MLRLLFVSSFCAYLHLFFFFFFNDTATTEIYTLSLHDALPISAFSGAIAGCKRNTTRFSPSTSSSRYASTITTRSEEHTSELQSRLHLVCRLLLEKKKRLHQHRDENRHRASPVQQAEAPAPTHS